MWEGAGMPGECQQGFVAMPLLLQPGLQANTNFAASCNMKA
jgi:hypothetical protein